MRQFLYDGFNILQYEGLSDHHDDHIKAIAVKTIKEIKYHYRYSSEWVLRLGEGTEKSHSFMQNALNELWRYTGEMFEAVSYELQVANEKTGIDPSSIKAAWDKKVKEVFDEATLSYPGNIFMQTGGKEGKHSELMGYILTDLQFMQRAYPGCEW